MMSIRKLAVHARNELGTTAIEYALLGGFISVLIVAAVTVIGGKVMALYTSLAAAFT